MIYTYPSNRLENLVAVLQTLLDTLERPPLAADTVLVQNAGMQHWLSMELARQTPAKVCMNVEYQLPVRYLWQLIRWILGAQDVPEQSPYAREILAWRIYGLLASQRFTTNAMAIEPTQYWRGQITSRQPLRRFQLAEQIADVFEQYLMYRPDWIAAWEQGQCRHWQALLWQALVAEQPDHPLALMKRASLQLKNNMQNLPRHFYIFGLNTMAPIWLEFLHGVSIRTAIDIHILYMNPCAEHWDNLLSEKQSVKTLVRQQGKQRALWLGDPQLRPQSGEADDWPAEAGNPLLTSLGQQGQAFVRLLTERTHQDIPVFTEVQPKHLLSSIQHDILVLQDKRQQSFGSHQQGPATNPQGSLFADENISAASDPAEKIPEKIIDNTVTITSAHSAFREVQGLHDWLLHQFNNDTTLTPKDVLVICPNVEDYAAFVQAVFDTGFAEPDARTPRLPCSIADRNLKDADANVAAFLELLHLPDARLEISRVLSWLRVPAIARKFSFSVTELATITQWLAAANVHWGLDQQHRASIIGDGDGNASAHFTWQQGLDRLLLGFAYGEHDAYVNEQMLLHHVEGEQAQLLGRLASLIDAMGELRRSLLKERTPAQWQQFLLESLLQTLMATEQDFESSHQTLLTAINDFADFANQGGYANQVLPLSLLRHCMESSLAAPDPRSAAFMTGQVTVSSMIPMRSLPFRIIAVLGLNDGQFPRQRPPLGFDLMSQDKPRAGDRSRCGDDRYLFLEAIISARDYLYLSYQGLNIRNNEELPASLVLEELMDYLDKAYGFERKQDIRVLPLQPYSKKNYHGPYPSFAVPWGQPLHETPGQPEPRVSSDTSIYHSPGNQADLPTQWMLIDWIRFFSHPVKYFANKQLGLYFGDSHAPEIVDDEPFDLNHLDRYGFQQDIIERKLAGLSSDDYLQQRLAESAMPLSSTVAGITAEWSAQALQFAQALIARGASDIKQQPVCWQHEHFSLTAKIPVLKEGQLMFWRLADLKGKDVVTVLLHHLLVCTQSNAADQEAVAGLGLFRGNKQRFTVLRCDYAERSRELLSQLHDVVINGLQEPVFCPAELFTGALTSETGVIDEKTFNKLWDDPFQQRGWRYDPYIQYVFNEKPDYQTTVKRFSDIMGPALKLLSLSEED